MHKSIKQGSLHSLFADRQQLEQYIIDRLKSFAASLDNNHAFYKGRLSPIKSLSEIVKWPLTTKEDLLAYPSSDWWHTDIPLLQFQSSSGSQGKPFVTAYTKNDLFLFSEAVGRCLEHAGVKKGDTLHNAYGYGLFTGGIGLHLGARHLDLRVIPASSGQSLRQVELINMLRPDVIAATPSYLVHLIELYNTTYREDFPPKIALVGAEPWSELTKKWIETHGKTIALNIYGLSEIIGPGVAQNGVYHEGSVLWEDLFYPEIVDPNTGETMPEGSWGELVLTSFMREATPLVRYRTGDITRLLPPVDGLPFRRIDRIRGRTDDMIKVKGVKLFVSDIESVLGSFSGELSPYFQVEITQNTHDPVALIFEAKSPETLSIQHLQNLIKSRFGVTLPIRVVPINTLPRAEQGKSKKIKYL